MLNKFLSTTTLTATLYLYAISQIDSSNPIFLLKTDNLAVNLALIALAIAAVYISFYDKFKSLRAYISTVGLTAGLSLLGTVGMYNYSLHYAGTLQPLDYILIVQLAITFAISTLSASHPPIKLALRRVNWLPLIQLKNNLVAILMPAPSTSRSKTLKPQLH